MSAIDEAALARAALETVREASAGARLIDAEGVLEGLCGRGFGEYLETPPQADPVARVAGVLAALPELASFTGLSGRTAYHDPTLLGGTYARILDRKAVPVVLLAEEIRANSRDYPRPVPMELFEGPPFDLTSHAIEATLAAMDANPAFADITRTTTGDGAVYLFSSRYLEPRYAAFLAERDAAFAANP